MSDSNQLNGTIPTDIGRLASLAYLNLCKTNCVFLQGFAVVLLIIILNYERQNVTHSTF
jgi:hypothetical protein